MYFFFFNDTATTEIYTLSLHDALPISRSALGYAPGRSPGTEAEALRAAAAAGWADSCRGAGPCSPPRGRRRDRKSTRLNSSHANISYAVFCLKKKNILVCIRLLFYQHA